MKARLLILLGFLMISVSCFSQITITFRVDMAGQTIGPGGVHIAGQFLSNGAISITQDWEPSAAGSQLTLLSGTIYQVQVVFPANAAGRTLQFQFVRNNVWFGSEDYSEGNPNDTNAYIDNSCGISDGGGGFNRLITIPPCDADFTAVWNFCGTLTSPTLPILNVSNDAIICPNQSIQLSATGTGNIIWTPSTTLSCSTCIAPIASPSLTTVYTVKSTIGTCSITDSIMITVDTTKVYAGTDQTIVSGSSIQLIASGAASYLWQPSTGLSCTDCATPSASPAGTTTYTVQGTSINGCNSSDTIIVYVTKPICENVFFPTAFSPNNDNINETFGPLFSVSPGGAFRSFRIYNIWGQLIFETKDHNKRWDGKYGGMLQSAGIYIYYVVMECNGKNTSFKGTVTVFR